MSVAVISDTHFGSTCSALSRRDNVDYLIWELWRYGDGIDEVVLLGDILDLWRVRMESAIRDATYFFRRLDELGVRVSYVVGNHDHHMTIIRQELSLLERAARGEPFAVYLPNLRWSMNLAGLKMTFHYPTYEMLMGGRRLLFTHGHHLDGIKSLPVQIFEGIRRLSGEPVLPADLERMMAYAYESIYRSCYLGEAVEIEESLWRVTSIFERVRSGVLRTLRYSPVESQYDAILRFIRERHPGRVDCFIYGDTHQAAIYRKDGDLLVANAGSLADGGDNTYLILTDDEIRLRGFGRQEPLMRMDV